MIVRTLGDRIQLITQPDHAHLARTIMERCPALADHPRRTAILDAVAEHDNGWAEEDAAPTVNPATGQVADFVGLPLAARHAVWPRAVGRIGDDWAAALVAHHAVTVYERFRADARWSSFFAEMEATRGARQRASGLDFEILLADYPFLRLGDLISLAFCTGATEAQQFGAWTIKPAVSRVAVTPDLFGRTTIPIAIAAREIPNRRFQSDPDLGHALSQALPIELRGEVVPGDTPVTLP